MFFSGWSNTLLRPQVRSERTQITGVLENPTTGSGAGYGGDGQAIGEMVVPTATAGFGWFGAKQFIGELTNPSAYANRHFASSGPIVGELSVSDTFQLPLARGIDIYDEGSLVAPGAKFLDIIGQDIVAAADGDGASVSHATISTASVTGSNQTIDSFAIATAPSKGAIWYYTAEYGSNQRTGYMLATWEGVNIAKGDFSTSDLGDTVDFSLTVTSDGTTVTLESTTTNTWSVSFRRMFV